MNKPFFPVLEAELSRRGIKKKDVAKELGMSASTLYRKMKALTGASTNGYLRHYKIQYAERLLMQGKYTISEIAFMVGINSIAYFRKCFKDEFGCLPSEYLRKISAKD